jgi:hypothetical protein
MFGPSFFSWAISSSFGFARQIPEVREHERRRGPIATIYEQLPCARAPIFDRRGYSLASEKIADLVRPSLRRE